MKKGLIYGAVAWFISLLIMPFIAPLIFSNINMYKLGRLWFPVSFIIVAVPAYIIGLRQSKKDS